MSIRSVFKLFDAPLAIVIGGVGLVLIVLQLGALLMVAESQVDRAAERDAALRETRMQAVRCMGAGDSRTFASCRQIGRTDQVAVGGETIALR